MNRRDFLKGAFLATTAAACGVTLAAAETSRLQLPLESTGAGTEGFFYKEFMKAVEKLPPCVKANKACPGHFWKHDHSVTYCRPLTGRVGFYSGDDVVYLSRES